jgi:hypothetical protein
MVVIGSVVSRFSRHGHVRLIAIVFEFAAKDFHFSRRRQTQRDTVAGDALHDDLDAVSDDDAFSDFPAKDQHGSLPFLNADLRLDLSRMTL